MLSPSEGDFLFGVADTGTHEHGIVRNRQRKDAGGVGNRSDRSRALQEDAGSDDGFTIGVPDRPGNPVLGMQDTYSGKQENSG